MRPGLLSRPHKFRMVTRSAVKLSIGNTKGRGSRPFVVKRLRTLQAGSGNLLVRVEELFIFGRAMQRGRGRLALLDGLGHGVEVAGAHFALVLHRGKATLGGG